MQTFNLSASQLKMRIVNFREISFISLCFTIIGRVRREYYYKVISEGGTNFMQIANFDMMRNLQKDVHREEKRL